MNQQARLPIHIEIVRHSTQTAVRLQFSRKCLSEWCLGLCLLREGLIDAFTVTEEAAKNSNVKFLVGAKLGARSRVTLNEPCSEVVLTKNGLDHMCIFFLKYYRDGVADVDHLDLEAVDAETGGREIYITFQASESRTPMTPDEAKRRLKGWS